MSGWDTYASRMGVHGSTKREASKKRESRMIINKLPDNMSYQNAIVDDVERNVAIINSDNLNEKTIISLPGEDIRHGAYVEWMNEHWLITERDANTTLYARAKMIQCNYLLKWVDDSDVIHEQWCIVEDGTKYLTGEYEDRNFIVTRGDSRIAITIAKNEFTAKLDRENRFLVDDPDSGFLLAYQLTKPLKISGIYNGNGVYKFVLQEVTGTKDDNQELRIADYYKHFPQNTVVNPDAITTPETLPVSDETGKKVWL